MTSLNNPVNLPLDTNGYVKSSIWGQNMNPNVNNVGGSVAGSVGSVTNKVISLVTISHQTGLSGTPSTAKTPVNVGSAIAIANDGLIYISVAGHVSANIGGLRIARTRSGITDYINTAPMSETSSVMDSSLFTDGTASLTNSLGFNSVTRTFLNVDLSGTTTLDAETPSQLIISVLNGDSLQFQVTNSVGNDTTYIDDLVVQQQ